ncbi:MAG: pantoate kinase [archaeon]|nr:pantoate kinase [archaeon]
MSFQVYVPGYITGFFEICPNIDSLKNGSCGAGFLLSKGVLTTIKSTHKDENTILINGEIDKTKEPIINKVLELLDIDYPVKIKQDMQLPVDCGFGTSACQALGVPIGLCDDFLKAGQIAHLAEVNLGSGLGDVIAQTGKGMVLRTKPGAPGIGDIESFICEDLYVGCKSLDTISTSSIITDDNYKRIISENGLVSRKSFMNDKSIENFLKLSYDFSYKTKLMSKELSEIIYSLNENDEILGASMAILGQTVFAFSYDKNTFDESFDVYKLDNNGIKS